MRYNVELKNWGRKCLFEFRHKLKERKIFEKVVFFEDFEAMQMFFSGSDSSKDTSGVVLIPTRFVWPYGGRRVFVSGTFTRWSEPVPMSPVEGCPNVFQAICGVTLGFHQYKFYVDGEWRHDEHQPHVTGNYGIVNTLLLTREHDPVPPILSPATPENRMNMDVDNEVFRRVETMRISESDVEISRHRISVFLSQHTAYELLPESGKVIALDVNLPVKQAFHILYEQGMSTGRNIGSGHERGGMYYLDDQVTLIGLVADQLDHVLCWRLGHPSI